jgi:hypothetical protein
MKANFLVRSTGAGILLVLLLCSLLPMVEPWQAKGDEQEFKPTVIETKSITLDELGNGRVSHTIQYKKDALYQKVSKLAKKYKNFISRHYGREDTLKVVENFTQKIDDTNKRIVLTYDSPGYAYNWEEYWSIGGMQDFEVTKKTKKTLVFKEDYNGRSDLTYYTTQPIRSVFEYVVPKSATNLQYDKDAGRVKYDLKPAPPGFFDANKTWLSMMFGVLALLFLGLLVLFVVKTRRIPSADVVIAPVVPTAKETESTVQPEAGERTCRNCGKQAPEGKKYCSGCGQPL